LILRHGWQPKTSQKRPRNAQVVFKWYSFFSLPWWARKRRCCRETSGDERLTNLVKHDHQVRSLAQHLSTNQPGQWRRLRGTVNFLRLAQPTNRHKFHLPFRACHLFLACEGDFAIGAGPVTYRKLPELAQLAW